VRGKGKVVQQLFQVIKNKKMIVVQFSCNSNNFFFFFFNDQSLDLFFYIWALNIKLLILKKKKVVRIVRNLCKKHYSKKKITDKKMHIVSFNWYRLFYHPTLWQISGHMRLFCLYHKWEGVLKFY
jgi:hypothetical protein